MKHLLSDHEDRPNQHEKSHKLCNETTHPVLALTESKWILRQQHDQNILIEGISKILAFRRKKEIQKCSTVRVTVMGPSKKVNNLNKVI